MKLDSVRILHIHDEVIYLTETFRCVTYEEFLQNRTFQLSAQKSLEIIGEAANSISSNLKLKYPEIPWDILRGLRNRLTHRYYEVSWPMIWEIIQDDVPNLKEKIQHITRYAPLSLKHWNMSCRICKNSTEYNNSGSLDQ